MNNKEEENENENEENVIQINEINQKDNILLHTSSSLNSKENSNIIVPQYKMNSTDQINYEKQILNLFIFNENNKDYIDMFGIDLGGYNIGISRYSSDNKYI